MPATPYASTPASKTMLRDLRTVADDRCWSWLPDETRDLLTAIYHGERVATTVEVGDLLTALFAQPVAL